MTKFEIFRRQASVGAHVTLRLTRGDDITGRVTELDDTHICLDREEGPITVLEDLLAAWEVHRGDTIGDPANRAGKAHSRPDAETGGSQAPSATPPVRGSDDTAPEVLQELVRVKAEILVTVDRARSVPPEPDFRFPETEVPAHLVQDLESASHDDLANIEVDGVGFNLHFPKLDADLYVPALVAGVFGTRNWMYKALARRAGRSKSPAKTAASRSNGTKGGRPKKQVSR